MIYIIKAIIFDLDGTLIDSLEDLADSSNYALSVLGYPIHNVQAYKEFIGDGVLKLMERILPKEKVTDNEILKIRDLQIEHYKKNCFNKTKPYDGISELLVSLKKQNYKLAVVSNKPDELAQEVVTTILGLDVFDVVTGKKEGFKAKPDPELTISVINELGVVPDECVFIGDSGMDMMTAVNAKVYPIGVRWGFRTEKELTSCGAKKIIVSPLDIINILNNGIVR